MAKVWLISDTHFGHENIIKFCNRPFKNVTDMNETMQANWNRLVAPEDIVWHLGDVYFKGKADYKYYDYLLGSLNGRKNLILGNHDNPADPILAKHFKLHSAAVKWNAYNMVLSHYPLHPDAFEISHKTGFTGDMEGKAMPELKINIHGHIHENPAPVGPYMNLCVEHWDYSPVELTKVLGLIHAS